MSHNIGAIVTLIKDIDDTLPEDLGSKAKIQYIINNEKYPLAVTFLKSGYCTVLSYEEVE